MRGFSVRLPHVLPFEVIQPSLDFFVTTDLSGKADVSRRRLPILRACGDKPVQHDHQDPHAAKLENPQPCQSSRLDSHRPALLQVSDSLFGALTDLFTFNSPVA